MLLEVGIGRAVDLTHAASADLGGDFVGAEADAGGKRQACGLYGRLPRGRD